MRDTATIRSGLTALVLYFLTTAAPAMGGALVDVDDESGVVLPGLFRELLLVGEGQYPFGPDFGPVASEMEVVLTSDQAPGHLRAIFPGHANETIEVVTGESVLFEYSFTELDFQVTIRDIDPVRDFGGGLGAEFSFAA